MSRRFVSEHAGQFPVKRLCELVELPRSSYYEWSRRPLSQHYLDDVDLAVENFEIHETSRRTYGAPRVAGQLHDRGRHHGTKRIARLMGECGLVGVHGRKKWRRGKRPAAPADDLLERDFSPERWVADISELKCRDGKLYLAGIEDLHDRGLAGWSMGEQNGKDPSPGSAACDSPDSLVGVLCSPQTRCPRASTSSRSLPRPVPWQAEFHAA